MDDGFFEVDKERCKGCGICHRECWFGAISMAEEE
jgi:Pyruvate/2-oxoacid:ferredoxin oxidoreductase delta subunit